MVSYMSFGSLSAILQPALSFTDTKYWSQMENTKSEIKDM